MSLLLLLRSLTTSTVGTVFLDGFRIEGQFTAGVWTSFGRDVLLAPGIAGTRGLQSNGPLDLVAPAGVLNWALRNDAGNTHGLQGCYSRNNANILSGFVIGMPIRAVAVYGGVDYVLWRGKLKTANPDPGKHLTRRVHCTAVDCMSELAKANVRAITPQIDSTEVDLLDAIIAALPATAQPPATDFDAALDVYPYSFDNIAGGVKAMTAGKDVLDSAQGYWYPKNDGTLRYENRHQRPGRAVSYSFSESELILPLEAPDSLDNVYNRVRVTYHKKEVSSTIVLHAELSKPTVAPGQTVTLWGSYRDPTNTLKLIGGRDFVAAAANTDFIANTADDGSGTDMTASVTVVSTGFAADVKYELTNNGSQTAIFTTLQCRGKGIYDDAPATVESYVAMDYGDRPLDIDLPFQDDANIAQDLADYVAAAYSDPAQVDKVSINPQQSAALMLQALTREIGDVIGVTETVTGLSDEPVVIQGVNFQIKGKSLFIQWPVAPLGATNVFRFDDPVFGVFDAPEAVFAYA